MASSDPFSIFTSLRFDPSLLQVPDHPSLSHAGWNRANGSPLYMLDYHRDRLLRAATHWRWAEAVDRLSGDSGLALLARQAEQAAASAGAGAAPDQEKTPLRLRIVVDPHGAVTSEAFKTPACPLVNLFPARLPPPPAELSEQAGDGGDGDDADPRRQPCYALLVDSEAIARSEFTHFKTTRRAMYDAARRRAGISPSDEKEVLVVSGDDGSVMEGTTTTPYFLRAGRWVTPPVAAKFSWDDGSGGQDGTSRRWALER